MVVIGMKFGTLIYNNIPGEIPRSFLNFILFN